MCDSSAISPSISPSCHSATSVTPLTPYALSRSSGPGGKRTGEPLRNAAASYSISLTQYVAESRCTKYSPLSPCQHRKPGTPPSWTKVKTHLTTASYFLG
jgi:hypothetical protein